MNSHQQYLLIKLFIRILSILPKGLLLFFADVLGLIWYHIDKRHRNVVLENVDHAFPGKYSREQLKRFALKNFQHTAGILFEVIWSYGKPEEKLFSRFVIKGKAHIEAARQKGRGIIVVTCHMGNFELMVAGIAKTGVDPYCLYRKLDYRPLDRLLTEIRSRFGTQMIPLRKASKKVEALLDQGEMVGTLLDQNVDWYKGVFVDFFGRPACTNNGLAKLVLKKNPVVLPISIRRENKQYIFEIGPELDTRITGDRIKDIENLTQAFVSSIEKMVRKKPVQYFWVHNRWKTKSYCPLGQNASANIERSCLELN